LQSIHDVRDADGLASQAKRAIALVFRGHSATQRDDRRRRVDVNGARVDMIVERPFRLEIFAVTALSLNLLPSSSAATPTFAVARSDQVL
jgi:hypothetical protein